MTLQNGLIYERDAYLWSDTALWNEFGQRVATVAKIFAGADWPWWVIHSGDSPTDDAFKAIRLLTERGSVSRDALLADAQAVLRAMVSEGRECRFLFAFPCEASGARLYHMAAEAMPEREPFEIVRVGKYLSSGGDADWYAPHAAARTPEEMRALIACQLADNGEDTMGMKLSHPVSDIIQQRVGPGGFDTTQWRPIDGQLVEVPLGEGLNRLFEAA